MLRQKKQGMQICLDLRESAMNIVIIILQDVPGIVQKIACH